MFRAMALKWQVVTALSSPPPESLATLMEAWTPEERSKFAEESVEHARSSEKTMKQCGLWPHLTGPEQQFMRTPASQRQPQMVMDASWLMESLECLLWALGSIDSLPSYDTQAVVDHLKLLPGSDWTGSVKDVKLRDRKVLETARGVAELWHWRSRTRELQESGRAIDLPDGMTLDSIVRLTAPRAAQNGAIPALIGDDFPAFGRAYRDLSTDEWALMASIARERHKAFNWLCGLAPRNRWDETPTDT